MGHVTVTVVMHWPAFSGCHALAGILWSACIGQHSIILSSRDQDCGMWGR
jgi:hypothetical protein